LLTILVLAYFVFSEFIDDVGFFAALLTYVWGVLSMRLCGLYWQRLYWQNWLPDGSPSLGEVRLKLGSDGIEASDASKVGKYSWQAFSEISQSGNLVILWFDRGQGILVPERAFANEEMRQTFIGAARGHVAPTQA